MTRQTYQRDLYTQGSTNPSLAKDSPIRWALTAFRLPGTQGSVTGIQQRGEQIYVCVRKGEDTRWVTYQKVMSRQDLERWVSAGSFK
jgi:hypothetical protein